MKIQTKNINNHIKRHHKKYLFGIFLGGIGFFIVKALILLTSLFGIFNYNPTLAAGPTTYYVSASGDDSNNGTSISTPRKTLTKVNAQTLLPGDSILFKRGDIFTGSLIFTGSKSGTSTDPIILSAYGTGDNPVLNGFEVLSSWTNMGSGIYKSICSSCSGSLNMLTIDGVNTPMGRYPNVNYADGGYLTFESFVHNTSITDNELTSTINWSGADVVIRKNRRVMDRAPIISHSGGTITYNSPTSFGELNGFGYFLQNDIRTLDQNGERYFNPVDKSLQIYLGSDNPNDFLIKAASIDNLVSINGPDYIIFSGMTFEGANNYAFYLPNFSFSDYITIKNSIINLIGDSAIYDRHSSYLTLENSLIKNINNQGYGSINNNNTTIRNNIFRDIGLFAGMGAYGGSSFHAIQLYGAGGFTIDSNIIENIGYIPINFFGDNSVAKNNFISGYCLIKDDGAGIYIYADSSAGTGKIYTGHKMLDNIIINGGGRLAKKGVSASDSGSSSANGLYTDGVMNSVEIARNTVANIGGYGIHMNNPRFNNIHDNVFYNSRKGGIDFSNLNSNSGFLPSGNIVNNNTVYITDKDQPNVNLSDGYGQYLLNFGNTNTITNNRYVQLHQSMPIFKVQVMPWNVRRYPFSQRKEVVNADISSQLISTNISSYKINFLTGANKISNGSFSTGLGSFTCYSMGTCNISRDSSSSLDFGALKFVYNTGSITNQDYVTRAIGSISSGKNYILKFSAVGLYSGDVIGVDIRKTDPDWRTLIPLQYIQINNHRTEYELLFSSTLDYSTTSIDFRLVGYTGGTIWLDNIELYEADILPTNLDDYIFFDYNASTGEKTVNLTNSYRDIFGSIYSDSTIIQPYSSIVLFKIPDKPTFNVVTISGSAVVDINYSVDSFKKEYSLDGLVYLDYTGSIVISDSVTIYAKGQDIDGNRSDISDYIITVANDQVAPIGTISYSTTGMTSGNVTVTISLNENGTITNNGGSNSYIFTNNGDFTFTYEDLAGNTGSETASVSWIDKDSPIGTINYSTTGMTSGNVTVTISLNESGTITNNGGSDSYIFTNNGDFTFTYKDLAGNTGSETASVSRIDNILPTITGVTSGGIYTSTATLSATDNIGVIGVTLDGTSLQSWTNYTISTIGLHTIIVNDLVGNISSTTFEIKASSSVGGGGGGGGGGGSSKTKDNCPNGDYSTSYYDSKCGTNPNIIQSGSYSGFSNSVIKSIIPPSIVNLEDIPTKQDIINNMQVHASAQTKNELAEAYQFALENKLTTITNIEKVGFTGILTRIQMAKMISNYTINVMGKTGTIANASKCSFDDLKPVSSELKTYAIISCQLGLMGMDSRGGINKNFNPFAEVTRAQFGTILSRSIRGDKYNKAGLDYYTEHLKELNKKGIVNYISGNPAERKELRGWAMIMMKRASEK